MPSLEKSFCDHFGLQIMQKADPDLSETVTRILLENGFIKNDVDKFTELYRELDFMPDGGPDIESILSIHSEILNAVDKANKKISLIR